MDLQIHYRGGVMKLTKKELSVLCSVLNGVNTKTSTHYPFIKNIT